ncbi:MAG TPA: hypothetical protein VEW95_12645, partial [Candidatus Limnocylindrales bacterium]|nr:hypothetical protein [Candidatus Limnocylindrales bacterium]
IPADSARQAWRLWPLLLVVIGLAVIASRTPFGGVATLLAGLVAGGLAGTLVAGVPDGLSMGCGGEPTESVSAEGSFSTDGAVELDFSCGELEVSTQNGTDWSVVARHGSDEVPEIDSDTESLRVSAEGGGFIGLTDSRQAWDVVLPQDASLTLTVDSNAASSRLDLDDADLSTLAIDANAGEIDLALPGAEVRELSIDANAGSVSIKADEVTLLDGSIEMNAGSLELCAPDDLAIAITIEGENVTFSHNLDDSGLSRQGDTWSSGDGEADVRLDVNGNAASFTLNPEGGCE